MGKAINPIGNRRLEVSTNKGKFLTQSQISIEEYENYNPTNTLDDSLIDIANRIGVNPSKKIKSFSSNSIIDDYYDEINDNKNRNIRRVNTLDDEDYPYTISDDLPKRKRISKPAKKIIKANNFEDDVDNIYEIEEANDFNDIELTEEEEMINSIKVEPKKQIEKEYNRKKVAQTHNEHSDIHEIEQRKRKMPEIKDKPEVMSNNQQISVPNKNFVNINKLQKQFQKKWGNKKV